MTSALALNWGKCGLTVLQTLNPLLSVTSSTHVIFIKLRSTSRMAKGKSAAAADESRGRDASEEGEEAHMAYKGGNGFRSKADTSS